MKYIRTKDGRIIPFLVEDKETELPKRDLRFYYIQPNNVIAFIGRNEILKQADTIPELCDRVVVKNFDEEEPRVCKLNNYNWEEIANLLFNKWKVAEWVKFAIWTDKGLIYKAKMNKQGEIELL